MSATAFDLQAAPSFYVYPREKLRGGASLRDLSMTDVVIETKAGRFQVIKDRYGNRQGESGPVSELASLMGVIAHDFCTASP